ncbi:MAG: hypothetical protein WC876_02120 [Candidatus Thermoplasmatota archaeon]|jgi:hypothetical protein
MSVRPAFRPILVSALVLAALAPAASAWADPAQANSPESGQVLSDLPAALAFIDGDGDGNADAATPDEPAYLDLDASQTVSYGDLRLTPFAGYPAGSMVDLANRDTTRVLSQTTGWLGVAQGAWYADLDGGGRLSAGDVRLDGATAGSKASAATPGLGDSLLMPPMAASPRGHLDHVDADHDGRWAIGSPLFVDLDGDGRASTGDLRLAPTGFGREEGPSPDEMQAAHDAALAAAAAANAASTKASAPAWAGLGVLIGLMAATGVVWLYLRSRRPTAPRNPFK